MKKLLIFFVCAQGLLCAQDQISVPSGSSAPSSLKIVLNPPTISVGGTSAVTSTIVMTDASTNTNDTYSANCVSANTGVATLPTGGGFGSNLATGVAAGTSLITCTDGPLTGSATLTVSGAPVITTPQASTCGSPCVLPTATASEGYSFQFVASAVGTQTWDCNGSCSGVFPSGITLSSSGLLSGTTATIGTTNWTVRVCVPVSNCVTLAVQLVVASSVTGLYPTLPTTWVNNQEGNTAISAPTYTVNFPSSGMGGSWTCGATNYGPYTAGSQSSLQQAFLDVEACRTANAGTPKILLKVPNQLFTGTNGIYIPQSSNSAASGFIAVISTQDSSLPSGTTVCAHGIQDNLATSTDPGIDNPACNGSGMYYQLGTTITNISAGAFTLANGTMTNTSNYNDVQYMWTVECSGTNCVPLKACSPLGSGTGSFPACASGPTGIAPDHWLIEDVELRPTVGNTGGADNFSTTDNGNATSTSQWANHIHLRKVWSHGDWTTLTAGANAISNGFNMSACVYCSVVDSQVSQALRPGSESHQIQANGSPYKFDHNWLEGESSGIFSGGYSNPAGPAVPNYIPFQDVEARRNRLTFPYSWLGQMTVPGGNAHWSGQSLVRKNCWEFKEGERILRDGNICENVDNSGGQAGVITNANVRNTSATGHGSNYQSTINDLTISNELRRNSCQGPSLSARSSSSSGSGGGVSQPMRRVMFSNNLDYNESRFNPGCSGTNAFGFQFLSAAQSWHGTIQENSGGTQATFTVVCSVDGGDCPAGPPSLGFAQSGISAGDPIFVTGCTGNTAFNAALHTLNGKQVAVAIGPAAISSTTSTLWTVTYPWTAPGNATDTSGNCTLSNGQGAPQNLIVNHETIITDANAVVGNGNTVSVGANFQLNHYFSNSIMTNGGATAAGWYNSSTGGEGTTTECFNDDCSSMTANYLIFPTRLASKYSEWGNNPNFPASCTGAGCSPPVTIAFPATSYCPTPTPTSACIGLLGALNTSSLPLALTDYHNYALSSSSSFHNTASDGTDFGVNVSALDTAQTLNLYVCSITCGSPGPYADH